MGRWGKPYKTYTDKQKATALLMLQAAGYPKQIGSMKRVVEELGIPQRTLLRWYQDGISPTANDEGKEELVELVEETREELVTLIDRAARAALKQMDKELEFASYRDSAWVAAVFIDKLQLLSGLPTQNVKQAISFSRSGISTLPEHLTSGAIEGRVGEEEI